MRFEGICCFGKHPIRKQVKSRQEVQERERIKQAEIGSGVIPTQAVEDQNERTSAVEVGAIMMGAVMGFACSRGFEGGPQGLPAQLAGGPHAACKKCLGVTPR